MPDYVIYDVTVEVITPLHIGSGRVLLHQYDYVTHKGRTWRLNEDALLDAQDVEDPHMADILARRPPGELLAPEDFRADSPFFRYVLHGTPRAQGEGAELREQLKDPYDRPYLPGSTLKGALRTAIAWYAWGQRGLRPDVKKLGRKRQWAAQSYEHEIFGQDPNHDLLRALQVSDSTTVDPDRLAVYNVRVFNRVGQSVGPPIEVEGVIPKTRFSLTVKVDKALFSAWARRHGLRLQGEEWLEQLPIIVQAHTRSLMETEVSVLQGMQGLEGVVGFYRRLLGVNLPPIRCFVPLGWGTGWLSKTLGTRLLADGHFMAYVVDRYGLTRGVWRPGMPFPKSRRMVQIRVKKSSEPRHLVVLPRPMGWAAVTFRRRAVA